jgi:hypothetical protein
MRRIRVRCRLERDHSSEPAKTDFPDRAKLAFVGTKRRLQNNNCPSKDQKLATYNRVTGNREPKWKSWMNQI